MLRNRKKAFTLIELLVVIAIIAILAAILFPVFAQAKASAKSIATVSQLKQVTLAGLMYAGDWDDTVHLWRNANSADFVPEAGYYGMLEPYIKSKAMMFDNLRGVSVDTSSPTNYNWTKFVTISVNRNGWLGWEPFTPPSTFGSRIYRTITEQENPSARAAYMISARPTEDLRTGYDFVTDEAGCAVVVDPTTVSNTRLNRVYMAAQFHRGQILTGYGDGRAGRAPFAKVGKLNNTVDDAEDCAGYGPNNSSYIPEGIDFNYWGHWNHAND